MFAFGLVPMQYVSFEHAIVKHEKKILKFCIVCSFLVFLLDTSIVIGASGIGASCVFLFYALATGVHKILQEFCSEKLDTIFFSVERSVKLFGPRSTLLKFCASFKPFKTLFIIVI